VSDSDLLIQANAALHALVTGQQMVECDYNGRRVKFTPSNIDALRSYIAELTARINNQRTRGAIGFIL